MSRPVQILAGVAVLSLALNLFGAGYLLARVSAPPRPAPVDRWAGRTPGPDFALHALARDLPREARADLRTGLRDQRDALRPIFHALHETRERIADELTAARVDTEALRAQFAELRRLTGAVQEPAQDALVAVAADLPLEVRRQLAERILRHGRHDRDRRSDADDHDDHDHDDDHDDDRDRGDESRWR
ncbi:hypothetical protein CCR85_12195 [Rhodothalassium salexigens]|uniref:periplasmic heavy metal sensor n=1 Tax=Rhodothalassium salexigens TaxID=1086 RepID=UPI001911D571|nr:periplasmic heavy metal sensor [Rhodothalassium salexigens]MBK5912250.1 hypothetical protein [Rhodothalassium salexigens]MBK5921429.1 hypothetical protein [Rhodothalassium salexigens]